MKHRRFTHLYNTSLVFAAMWLGGCADTEHKAAEQEAVIIWDTTTAFFKDSMPEADEENIPLVYAKDEQYTLVPYPAYILPAGHYHAEEVTEDMKSADWYCLSKSRSGYTIHNAAITFARAHDDIVDDNPEDSTGWKVSGTHDDAIFISKVGSLQTGTVPVINLDTNIITPGKNLYFDYEGKQYRLYASAYRYKQEYADYYSVRNYKLYLEQHDNGKITTQLIAASPYHEDANFICPIIFAGDIDRDGLPDLIINVSNHYNAMIPALFLSGAAEEGKLLKPVAIHVSVGC